MIERMMHRSSIAVMGESAATYALIKLIPTGGGAARAMGLNIALVLDVSGSMYDEDGTGISRLKRVQEAASKSIAQLNPTDTISIIGFAHNAAVLLESTPVSEREKIEDVINKIDMFDVDPGGTSMDEGIALGMNQLENIAQPGRLSQIVVLTDGETSGEQNCRSLASKCSEKKVNLSIMGVGTDWKEALIKELARTATGKWYYIDTESAAATDEIFAKEFTSLASAGFADVEMHVRPMKDIKLKRVRQVVPQVEELNLQEVEERHKVSKLGTLQFDQPSKYIVDLSLPKRPDGKFVVATVEVTYDAGTGQRETTGPVPLEMTFDSVNPGYVNAEVMKHIDDIQMREMSANLEKALEENNAEQAQKVAEQIEKKGDLMGKRAQKKTMLAKQVLDEMNAGGGRVSKKTMLAMEDEMRNASEEA